MTEVKFADGRKVDVVDRECEFRPCFSYGLDRGPFVQGRGYTNPRGHVNRPVCNTRHLHGCPHQDGVADADGLAVLLRPRPCCAAPSVPRNPRAYFQTCRSCGTRLRGMRLEIAREASA